MQKKWILPLILSAFCFGLMIAMIINSEKIINEPFVQTQSQTEKHEETGTEENEETVITTLGNEEPIETPSKEIEESAMVTEAVEQTPTEYTAWQDEAPLVPQQPTIGNPFSGGGFDGEADFEDED